MEIIDMYCNTFKSDISGNVDDLKLVKRDSGISDLDYFYGRLANIAKDFISSINYFEYNDNFNLIYYQMNEIMNKKNLFASKGKVELIPKQDFVKMELAEKFKYLLKVLKSIVELNSYKR